jgi:uncharacterized membrane protein YhhN
LTVPVIVYGTAISAMLWRVGVRVYHRLHFPK